jgi:hypothetical protein
VTQGRHILRPQLYPSSPVTLSAFINALTMTINASVFRPKAWSGNTKAYSTKMTGKVK